MSVTYSYNRLWKLLIDKGLNRTELKTLTGLSTNVIAKMGRNENVNLATLAKVCAALKCELSDIVEVTGGNGTEGNQ